MEIQLNDGKTFEVLSYQKNSFELMLDTIVALEPGHHTFVGSFQITENGIVAKHKNYYATDINFAFDVEMSKTYHVGIYKENENNEKVILSLPLAVDGFSSRTLYLIATYE